MFETYEFSSGDLVSVEINFYHKGRKNKSIAKDTVSRIKDIPNRLITMVEKTRLLMRNRGLDAPVFMKPVRYIKMNIVGWGNENAIAMCQYLTQSTELSPAIFDTNLTSKIKKYLVLEFMVLDEDFNILDLDLLGATRYVFITSGTPGVMNWLHDKIYWNAIKKEKINYNKTDNPNVIKKTNFISKISDLCDTIKIGNDKYLVAHTPIASAEFRMLAGVLMKQDYYSINSHCIRDSTMTKKYMNKYNDVFYSYDNIDHEFNFIMVVED